MIRVPGDMPIGVDVDWPSKLVTIVRTDMRNTPAIARLFVAESAALRLVQESAEEVICGNATELVTLDIDTAIAIAIEVELPAGYITWVRTDLAARPAMLRVSVLQSQAMRRLQQRAETVIATGVGDMTTP